MTKDQLDKSVRYQKLLKDKLSAPTPAKHASRPAQYRDFLAKDLAAVTNKINDHKLEIEGK